MEEFNEMYFVVHTKDGLKTVVQTKRYKRKVGLKAMQEAVGAKGFYQALQI